MKKIILLLIAFVVLVGIYFVLFVDHGYPRRTNAVVQATMIGMRTYSREYVKNTGSYIGICNDATSTLYTKEAEKVSGNKTECNDSNSSFAVQILLPNGNYFCVDINSSTSTNSIKTGALTCD